MMTLSGDVVGITMVRLDDVEDVPVLSVGGSCVRAVLPALTALRDLV